MSTSPPAVPPRRRSWIALGAIGAVVVVGLIVGLIIWRGGAGAPNFARPGDRNAASPTAPVALGPATPVPTDVLAPGTPHPKACADIYTTDWASSMAPLVLNPAWTEDPASGKSYGTADPGLEAILAATTQLTCQWAHPGGGGDVGLTTNIAFLTEAQRTDVAAKLTALGYSCYEELGGVRCVTEQSGDGASLGESHFLRAGLWFATRWVNISPDGYTHDMVNTVFGGA